MRQKFYVTTTAPPEPAASSTGTATGAAGAAVTLTIAAAGAGVYHYLHSIRIEKVYAILPLVAVGQVVVTTTNLGGLAWTFGHAILAIGNSERSEVSYPSGLRCAAPNTATTIVCPAQAEIIWRVSAVWRTGQ